jgi:hypothetical protein
MMLYPTLPGLGVQPCPFCGAAGEQSITFGAAATGAAGVVPRYDTYFLNGDATNAARLLLVDPRGRKLGWVGKRFLNQIPGARVVRPILGVAVGKRKQQPQLKVPAGRPMTVTIDGTSLKKATTVTFTIVVRGRFVSVRAVRLLPGQRTVVTRNAAGTSFTYKAGKKQTGKPDFVIGFEGAGAKPDRTLTISTNGVQGGSELGFTLDEDTGNLEIDATDDATDLEYDLEMETIDDDGVETVTADDLTLTDDESGTLDYEEWDSSDGEPPIDVEQDDGGDSGDSGD